MCWLCGCVCSFYSISECATITQHENKPTNTTHPTSNDAAAASAYAATACGCDGVHCGMCGTTLQLQNHALLTLVCGQHFVLLNRTLLQKKEEEGKENNSVGGFCVQIRRVKIVVRLAGCVWFMQFVLMFACGFV